MATAKLNIKGFEEYLEKIAQAGKDIDTAVDAALLVGAEIIQKEMQDRTPVGQAPKDPHPGNLRAHIKIKGPAQDGNYHVVEVGLIHDEAYTDAETTRYGNANEYGTARMPARSFIRSGINYSKIRVRSAMRKELERRGTL